MEQGKISDIVLEILKSKFQVSDNLLRKENFDEPFTGLLFSMDDITLTYLYLEINKILGNSLYSDGINNYEFNSINGIVEIIENT